MNKVRKFILSGAALVLAVGMTGAAMLSAQEHEGPGQRPFARGDRMHFGFAGAPLISTALKHKIELNLAGDQVDNLEKIRSHFQVQIAPLQQQLATLEKEIAALTRQSPANLIQIKEKIEQAGKYRSEIRYLRIEALENGRSVLSAQQQDQLQSLARSRHEHFRKQHGQPS